MNFYKEPLFYEKKINKSSGAFQFYAYLQYNPFKKYTFEIFHLWNIYMRYLIDKSLKSFQYIQIYSLVEIIHHKGLIKGYKKETSCMFWKSKISLQTFTWIPNLKSHIVRLVWTGQKWSELVRIGHDWSGLVRTGQDWSELVRTGQEWSVLVRTDQDQSGLVRTGQDWTGLVNWSGQSGYVRTGQEWSGLVKTVQNWSGLVRSGQDWSGPVRTCQERSGAGRTGQEWSGLDRTVWTGQDML